MELTAEQEGHIQKIMAAMDCSKGFHCYESGFEDLVPVKVISSNTVECLKAEDSYCRMAFTFGLDFVFCKCPLRKYVAFQLGR